MKIPLHVRISVRAVGRKAKNNRWRIEREGLLEVSVLDTENRVHGGVVVVADAYAPGAVVPVDRKSIPQQRLVYQDVGQGRTTRKCGQRHVW